MDLLVAHSGDPAGANMAGALAPGMEDAGGGLYRGRGGFDLLVTDRPAVSAEWLEAERPYGGYVFLSRHAAASGRLALTCHTTGNLGPASLGGRDREVAVPHREFHSRYMQELWSSRGGFPGFEVTIEATHHGPTSLSAPVAFVEVGTTEAEWNDAGLCARVARAVERSYGRRAAGRAAVCFGGGHYPAKLTRMAARGEWALGTVVPGRALGGLDGELFGHVVERNRGAAAAIIDWDGCGGRAGEVARMAEGAGLEVVRA